MGASFRELVVWQRAVQMGLAIYKLTSSFPSDERFGLINQLRRAAISVASNIAEGSGRVSLGEYLQFLGHARGSIFEVQTQLVFARELGYGAEESLRRAEALAEEVGKILNTMLAKLRSRNQMSNAKLPRA